MSSSTSILTSTLTNDFATYNWGPITSLFQPPTSCYQTFTSATSDGALFVGHNEGIYFDPACYPAGSVGTTYLETFSNWNLYYYSPAICPSGWVTAATFTSTFLGLGPGDLTSAISLGTDTSAFVCCPTSFEYQGIGHACTSVALIGETISYIYPTQAGLSQDRGTVTTSSVRSTTTIGCDGIPIWWQATDAVVLSAASTITSTASTSSTATNTQSSVTSTTYNTSTGTPSLSSGLSTGAKAAIGVCIPVVSLAILVGVFWFFRTHRKRAIDAHQGVAYEPHTGAPDKGPGGEYGYELDSERPVEIYTEDRTYNQPYNRPELPPQ